MKQPTQVLFLPKSYITSDIREHLQRLTMMDSPMDSQDPLLKHKSWREAVSSPYRTVSLLLFRLNYDSYCTTNKELLNAEWETTKRPPRTIRKSANLGAFCLILAVERFYNEEACLQMAFTALKAQNLAVLNG